MLEAKLVPGASEFVELDGQLAVVFGTAGAITSAWEELASSLRWLSPLVQKGWYVDKRGQSFCICQFYQGSTENAAGSLAGVSFAREISGGRSETDRNGKSWQV